MRGFSDRKHRRFVADDTGCGGYRGRSLYDLMAMMIAACGLLLMLCADAASSALVESLGCFTANETDPFVTADNATHGLASVVTYKNVSFSFTLFNETRCAEKCKSQGDYNAISVMWHRDECYGDGACEESLLCTCGHMTAGEWRERHRYGCPFPCNERVTLEVPGLWCVMYKEWTTPDYSRVFQITERLEKISEDVFIETDTLQSGKVILSDIMGSLTGMLAGVIIFLGIGLGIFVIVYKTGSRGEDTSGGAAKLITTEQTRLVQKSQEDQL